MHFSKSWLGVFSFVLMLMGHDAFAGIGGAVACQASDDHERILDIYLAKGDAGKEIKHSGCEDQKGAFLLGVDQGLRGQRFAFFYSRGANLKDNGDWLRKNYACSEYGIPADKSGNVARFDSGLKESAFKKYFLDPIGSILFEALDTFWNASKTFVNWILGRADSPHSLKNSFKKELKARKNAPLKAIDPVEALKEPRQATGDGKAYACCLQGFTQGAGILNALIQKSGTDECNDFSRRCKEYYRNGVEKADIACSGGKGDEKACSGCDITQIGNETESEAEAKQHGGSLLGCASLGYIRQLQNSPVCQAALQKQRESAAVSEQSQAKAPEVIGSGTSSGTPKAATAGQAK
ncbi:MAG: hypothetical protein A2X94_04590 [Bdellovibrionales bacterium GWB1_55_8]|nr:MAG: hypothetical protein A2X94_04590 [Bdellovibrionales bacterium GWB1_55_8]